MIRIKQFLRLSATILLILSLCACHGTDISTGAKIEKKGDTGTKTAAESDSNNKPISNDSVLKYDGMTAEEITATLSLEQKAYQMVIPGIYNITPSDMKEHDYGAVLSHTAGMDVTQSGWKKLILKLQSAALESEGAIPFYYGTDAVHGVGYCRGAVVFPHNIGIGAANDKELTYKMGLAVADELKLTGMLWNYSPCVAVDKDPRWGRTKESYSSDYRIVDSLAESYTRGLLEGGITVCAKHYLGDGSVTFGTGEDNRLIDRGDARLSEDEIRNLLKVYQTQVDAGVQSIMISHSSLNGIKMHENKYYITDVLKGEMGFQGFVVSDWESIQHISVHNLKDQVITSINAGIDMLMQPENFDLCARYIMEGVQEGSITRDRIDDAVTRIIRAKLNAGLFKDPMQESIKTAEEKVGSDSYRKLAAELVEKSLVLVKNENHVLPLRKNLKIYVTGPASNHSGIYCGGWTGQWMGMEDIKGGSTILDGLEELVDEYEYTIITDPDKAKEADVVLLCIGEATYAEWYGDTKDLSITGSLGLPGNEDAIKEAKELGLPTIACIVAGRNTIISDYIDQWDGVVMCYLPGTEAKAIANVLSGKVNFTGKLPMPWYSSVEEIGTSKCMFPLGYGLKLRVTSK